MFSLEGSALAAMSLKRTCQFLLGISILVCCSADEQDTHNSLEKIHLRNTETHLSRENIVFSVNVSTLEYSGQPVEVRWSGVHHPSFDDWIGILAPADTDISRRAPIKYKLASTDFDHIMYGSGKMRCDVAHSRFVLQFFGA